MRAAIATIVSAVLGLGGLGALGSLAACSNNEKGAEKARKQAEAELAAQATKVESAKKISPPVPGSQKVPCEQLIDLEAFQQVMEEAEPLGLKTKADDAEAAASCSILRGGKRLNDAEQRAVLKKEGRLGVLAGDEICYVNAYCWTIEDAERFKSRCKDTPDESMGNFACRQTVMVGAHDAFVYKFFDEDTKCILKVGSGPSNQDNELVRKCAIAARDSITPARIAVGDAALKKAADEAPAGDSAN
jgi:hypothetical protein